MKKTYEIAIYNQHVRDCVNDGEEHPQLKEDWADVHYIEIEADDEDQARNIALRRHPAKAGFVIVTILEL